MNYYVIITNDGDSTVIIKSTDKESRYINGKLVITKTGYVHKRSASSKYNLGKLRMKECEDAELIRAFIKGKTIKTRLFEREREFETSDIFPKLLREKEVSAHYEGAHINIENSLGGMMITLGAFYSDNHYAALGRIISIDGKSTEELLGRNITPVMTLQTIL